MVCSWRSCLPFFLSFPLSIPTFSFAFNFFLRLLEKRNFNPLIKFRFQVKTQELRNSSSMSSRASSSSDIMIEMSQRSKDQDDDTPKQEVRVSQPEYITGIDEAVPQNSLKSSLICLLILTAIMVCIYLAVISCCFLKDLGVVDL